MITDRAVLNAVRDAVFLADMDTGMIVDANSAAEALCGRRLAELRLLHQTSLHPPERTERAAAFGKHPQNPAVVEGLILHQDGRQIPVEISSSHFTAPDGRRILVGVFRDITEQVAILESIRDAFFACDAEWRFLYVNSQAESLLGISRENVLGKNHWEIFPHTSGTKMEREYRSAAAGETRDFETFCERKARWFHCRCYPREGGGISAYLHDITEQKKLAAALHEREALLRAITDSAPDPIFVKDLSSRLVLANPATLSVLGKPEEEVLGKTDEENFNDSELGRRLMAHDRAVMESGRSKVMEVELRTRDELRVFLSAKAPYRDTDGRIIGTIGIARDITERKQAEKALRESEQQLASIYNTVGDVIFYLAVEPQGHFRFVSVNAAFLRATGLKREAVIGKTVNEVIPEPSLTLVLERYRHAIKQKTMVSWEETSDYPTGRLIGDVTVAPLLDHNGTCTHLVGSVHDITERKRAEAALRESEERFRTMADTAPVMIWTAGPDKLCTFVNKSWLDFRGRTMEQELGSGWADGIHPEDLEKALGDYYLAFDDRRSFRMEYRLLRSDGEYRWILDNGTPRYGEREFAGFIGCCVDVTEQKRVEEQLRSNHAQLMDSQRLAGVGSWEREITTGAVRWSDEMYRIYGLPFGARLDFPTFLNLVHPKDRGFIAEADHKAISAGTPFEVAFRITRPSGEVRFIRSIMESIRNDQGVLVRMIGAAQDITEHVKAMELLRESEARLKTAERMTHVGNWLWDIKSNRVSWSEEIYRITGQTPGRQPGFEESLEMISPAERDRVEQWIRGCLAEKWGSTIEVRIVRPDGAVRTLVCTSQVVVDEDGIPERMLGACQDVTEDRRAQEELFAGQKLESLGALASGIAHDFNNLLGAVLAQAELAMAELEAGSLPDDELREIRDVAIRGSEIVRQLMIYAGKESDALEPSDISKTVEEMLRLLKVTVSTHATLVTDLGENLPPVKARAAQLRQIVMNLVVNASEATKGHDGVIRISTSRVVVAPDRAGAPPETLPREALPPGEYVQLEVCDNGAGMSPESRLRIFDPFFTTKSAGRGLGLAVVQGIVRSVNGAIRVMSEPGKGTTFQILLPGAEAAAGTAEGTGAGAHQATHPSRTASVLIVEDEDPLRLAVAQMLAKSGFTVLQAANGSEAMEMLRARSNEIDVILLDLTIPGVPSREVLALAAEVLPNTRVVLTSAYSEQTAKEFRDSPQVCGFVRKPFHFGKLLQQLRNALPSNAKP